MRQATVDEPNAGEAGHGAGIGNALSFAREDTLLQAEVARLTEENLRLVAAVTDRDETIAGLTRKVGVLEAVVEALKLRCAGLAGRHFGRKTDAARPGRAVPEPTASDAPATTEPAQPTPTADGATGGDVSAHRRGGLTYRERPHLASERLQRLLGDRP